MKIMKKPFTGSVVVLSMAAALMAGCSNLNPVTQQQAISAESSKKAIEISYKMPHLAEELARTGVQANFMAYWQAHKDQNWMLRYTLEDFPQPVGEKFYAAYYAKGWEIRSLQIINVLIDTNGVNVYVTMTLINPETLKPESLSIRDSWLQKDGAWKHTVQDPMLNGMFGSGSKS